MTETNWIMNLEARAAHKAGCSVCLVIRPGNGTLSEQARKDFKTIESLDAIFDL